MITATNSTDRYNANDSSSRSIETVLENLSVNSDEGLDKSTVKQRRNNMVKIVFKHSNSVVLGK